MEPRLGVEFVRRSGRERGCGAVEMVQVRDYGVGAEGQEDGWALRLTQKDDS